MVLQAYPRSAAADTVDAMAANELAAHATLQVHGHRVEVWGVSMWLWQSMLAALSGA